MNIQKLDLLRKLSVPSVFIYRSIIAVRNWLFDNKIFSEKRVSSAVISIGNITVGGSGKTPLVMYVTSLLKGLGLAVGVLSRGYGRTSRGYLLVSDGREMKTDVISAGDEIYYTALECRIPAAVSERRSSGAEKFIRDTGVQCIVLDDAFQHRWIHRDIDIVVMDQSLLPAIIDNSERLLPAGNLREPLGSLARADCVVLNRKFSVKTSQEETVSPHLKSGGKIFTAYYRGLGFVDIRDNKFYQAEEFKGQKSLVVSGVADPTSFISALNGIGVDTADKMIFTDHQSYLSDEVQNIRKEFYKRNSHSVITTLKDAVKLMRYKNELDDIDIYYLQMVMEFDDPESFENYVKENILINK